MVHSLPVFSSGWGGRDGMGEEDICLLSTLRLELVALVVNYLPSGL